MTIPCPLKSVVFQAVWTQESPIRNFMDFQIQLIDNALMHGLRLLEGIFLASTMIIYISNIVYVMPTSRKSFAADMIELAILQYQQLIYKRIWTLRQRVQIHVDTSTTHTINGTP